MFYENLTVYRANTILTFAVFQNEQIVLFFFANMLTADGSICKARMYLDDARSAFYPAVPGTIRGLKGDEAMFLKNAIEGGEFTHEDLGTTEREIEALEMIFREWVAYGVRGELNGAETTVVPPEEGRCRFEILCIIRAHIKHVLPPEPWGV